MKKLLFISLLFLSFGAFADRPISVYEYFDDTATIQAALNSHAGGTYTMPVFGTYHTTGTLTVPANTIWDINGNFVITSQTSGQAVIASAGSTIENGTIEGPWDYTTAPNPFSGGVGIKIAGSNVTITNCTISEFSSSGIIENGNYNNTVITHNSITKTGYIGFYDHAEVNGTHDVNFSYNVVDRSMISASTIQQPALSIRGATGSGTIPDTISNVTIAHNTINMPLNPTDGTAEGIDAWRIKNSRIDSNSVTGGTIGASVVIANNVSLTRNHFYNQRDEGIEMLGNLHCATHYNFITGAFTQGGFLIDCTNPTSNTSHYDTLYYDTIRTTGNYGVHTTSGTSNIVFNGLVIRTHQTGFYLATTDRISILSTNINGAGLTNTSGVYFATSRGKLTYTNGHVDSCASIIYGNNSMLNASVDSITFLNVSATATPYQKKEFFTNGAHWGPLVSFLTLASPAFSYSPGTEVLFTGTAMTLLSPVSTGGAISSYSINTALPAGLSFNTGTGAISGTPSAASVLTVYTITATNIVGTSTAMITLTIIGAPLISYTPNVEVLFTGTGMTNLSPVNTGGAVVSYSILPALPAGLSFNTGTGVVSGTPSTAHALTVYIVTATNSAGAATALITLTINAPLVLPGNVHKVRGNIPKPVH